MQVLLLDKDGKVCASDVLSLSLGNGSGKAALETIGSVRLWIDKIWRTFIFISIIISINIPLLSSSIYY